MSMLISEDLPTLDRPPKANSGRGSLGRSWKCWKVPRNSVWAIRGEMGIRWGFLTLSGESNGEGFRKVFGSCCALVKCALLKD